MERQRVLIVQRRMPEYRTSLFERLSRKLGERRIDLTISYGNTEARDILRGDEGVLTIGSYVSDHALSFAGIELVYMRIPLRSLNQYDLVILPHENRILLNFQLLLSRFPFDRIAFFGHGGNLRGERDSWKESLKSWVAKKGVWYFGYTALSVREMIARGFPEERITCLDNTIDVDELGRWRNDISPDEIAVLRTVYGIEGKNVGVFLGSLTGDKRLAFLFAAATELRKSVDKFELVIVGDGPVGDEVLEWGRDKPWVHWVRAKHGREKVIHAMLGKVILSPGMVGLNIVDSFGLGIPMVTTDCGIHSPEITYLKSGINGVMTDDNLGAFTACVKGLLEDEGARQRMEENCLDMARYLTLDSMVNNFADGIMSALSLSAEGHGCASRLPA